MKNKKGFTLIELLVVVLVIGILAGIALPQYQNAVLKSKFTNCLHTVKSLEAANEARYLETGLYAANFDELDINFPNNKVSISMLEFPWGKCVISTAGENWTVGPVCFTERIGVYSIPARSDYSWRGKRICAAYSDDLNDRYNKLCQIFTESTTPVKSGDVYSPIVGWVKGHEYSQN